MMHDHELVAFLATLAAMVLLVAIAAVLAVLGKYTEAIGVSAAISGLLGAIKMPRARGA